MSSDPRIALRTALAAYLAGAGIDADLVVSAGWPDPTKKLPAKALTVTIPGQPIEVIEHAPRVWNWAPGSGDTTSPVRYSYGLARFGVQLDLWTAFAAVRDQLVPKVQAAVKRPSQVTLGTSDLPRLSHAPGLVLRLTDFFGTPADVSFTALPDIPEGSEVAQRAEWRAIWQGEASVYLLAEESVSVIRTLVASLAVNGGAPQDITI